MVTSKRPKHEFASNVSTSNLIALSILVALLSIAAALIIGRMLLGTMSLKARVIGKKSTASKTINANYDALKALQGEYNNLGALRDTVATALPNKPSLPELWSMMESIGTASGVQTNSVTSSVARDVAAPAGGPLTSLPFTVSAQGSYSSIQTYLQNIEASTRPLRVTNVTLSGTNSVVQATLLITTYYQGSANIKVGSEVVQ